MTTLQLRKEETEGWIRSHKFKLGRHHLCQNSDDVQTLPAADWCELLSDVSKEGEAKPRAVMSSFWLACAAWQILVACVCGQCHATMNMREGTWTSQNACLPWKQNCKVGKASEQESESCNLEPTHGTEVSRGQAPAGRPLLRQVWKPHLPDQGRPAARPSVYKATDSTQEAPALEITLRKALTQNLGQWAKLSIKERLSGSYPKFYIHDNWINENLQLTE